MAALSLAFDIVGNDQNATKALKDVSTAAKETGEKVEEAGSKSEGAGEKIKSGMKIAATAVAAFAGVALVGLKSAADEASDLGESVNAVGVVFGDAGQEVLALGRNAAKSVGLSNTAFNSLAVQFSSFAQKIGGPGGTVKTLDDLTKRAADFASVMNLDVSEAAGIFQSALSGETEPIKAFGIDLSAAAVEAYAAANGIGRVGEALTDTEKTQATYGLLMQETAKTSGDFANTSDSLANRQRILSATFDNLKAAVGERVLPAMQGLFGFLLDTAVPVATQLFDILFKGDFTGGPLSEDSKIVDVAFGLRDGAIAAKDGAQQLFDVLFRGDFKGGPLSEDSAIVDKAFDLRDAAISLRDWWQGEALPALERFNAFLVETFQPTFEELARVTREDLVPAGRELKRVFDENRPAIESVLQVLGFLIVTLGILRLKVLGDVLPPLINLAGFLTTIFAANVGAANEVIRTFAGYLSDAAGWASTVYEKVRIFADELGKQKVPGWIRDLAGLVEKIAGGLGSAAGAVAGFLGDGPGRSAVLGASRGGSTLATVQKILPAGAVVTSTYRSPAQNAAVGGVPGSYHTDVKNPAVDIAGSRQVMDQVYAQLAAMGGWRELLYKTPGHWDHVHVAHQGGTVSSTWPSMPGWGPDERPVRAQVGETILAKGESVGADAASIAQAMSGMTFVLEVDGQPIRAIARVEATTALRTAGRR